MSINQIGKKNSNWKGGIAYDKKRKLIYSPYHPYPDSIRGKGRTRYCYEYKLIMEKYLGRFLKRYGKNDPRNEVIHHINNDETDNKLCNLKVMSQKEHAKIHANMPKWKKTHKKFLNVHKNMKRDDKGRWKKYGD